MEQELKELKIKAFDLNMQAAKHEDELRRISTTIQNLIVEIKNREKMIEEKKVEELR